MGLINCSVHGEVGVISYVSRDLCSFILSNQYVDSSIIRSIHAVFYDEGEELFDRFYFVSEDVFDAYALKEFYRIVSDEDELDFNEKMKNRLGSVCIACFKSYMEEIGYKYQM